VKNGGFYEQDCRAVKLFLHMEALNKKVLKKKKHLAVVGNDLSRKGPFFAIWGETGNSSSKGREEGAISRSAAQKGKALASLA